MHLNRLWCNGGRSAAARTSDSRWWRYWNIEFDFYLWTERENLIIITIRRLIVRERSEKKKRVKNVALKWMHKMINKYVIIYWRHCQIFNIGEFRFLHSIRTCISFFFVFCFFFWVSRIDAKLIAFDIHQYIQLQLIHDCETQLCANRLGH